MPPTAPHAHAAAPAGPDEFLVIADAARRAGVTRHELYVALALGELAAVNVSGKPAVRAAELARWGAARAA